MTIKTIATGSDGNCHVLTDRDGNMLLIEAGIGIREIKKGCGFNVTNIVGAIVTHHHQDHAKSVKNLEKMGIPVCKPYSEDGSHKPVSYGPFRIIPFPLDDAEHEWCHTNGDGSACPIYGFIITHSEIGRMLYITDCQFCRWTFGRYAPSTILVGIDYQEQYITDEDAKRRHVYGGHMSLDTACAFIKSNQTVKLKTVIGTHLSSEATNPDEVLDALMGVVPGADCYIATPGMEVTL